MSEEMNKEFDEMLDDVLGGPAESEDQSQEAESASKSLEAEGAPEAEDEFLPEGEEAAVDDSVQSDGAEEEKESTPAKADSVQEEKAPEPDKEKTALQEEIANYKKRLHDTQSAMHKANEEKAKLQKELDALKSKKESPEGEEENWFSNDSDVDDKKTAELESKIEAIEEKQEKYRQEQAVQEWNKEAAKVAAEHSDFETLVYEKLEPLLDEENGDPAILAAYIRWSDKSPAGAYKFAKTVFGTEEKLNSPSESPAKENTEAEQLNDPARGKAGLDRINSAEFAEPKRNHSNMIDEVFG